MEKYFALIRKNEVISVIVTDKELLSQLETEYDHIIDVSTQHRPSVGDSYYPDTNLFVSNNIEINHLEPDNSLTSLLNGTEDTFEPFNISKYSVSYSNKMIQIGCKQYSAIGMLHVLHKLLIDKKQTVHTFTSLAKGPTHGKFDITWEDAQLLYQALLRIKF